MEILLKSRQPPYFQYLSLKQDVPMGVVTGSISHTRVQAESLMKSLEASHDKLMNGGVSAGDADKAAVRIKSDKGRTVALLGDAQHKWHLGSGKDKTATEQAHASVLFGQIATDHGCSEVNPLEQVGKGKLTDRVVSPDTGATYLSVKGGAQSFKVMSYTEVRDILKRDILQFKLDDLPKPNDRGDIAKNLNVYTDAGERGLNRLADDLSSLPPKDHIKQFINLPQNIQVQLQQFDGESYQGRLVSALENLIPQRSEDVLLCTECYKAAGSGGLAALEHHIENLPGRERGAAFRVLLKDSELAESALSGWAASKANEFQTSSGQRSPVGADALLKQQNQFKAQLHKQVVSGANAGKRVYSDRLANAALTKFEQKCVPNLAAEVIQNTSGSIYGNATVVAQTGGESLLNQYTALSPQALSSVRNELIAKGESPHGDAVAFIDMAISTQIIQKADVTEQRLNAALGQAYNRIPKETQVSYKDPGVPRDVGRAYNALPRVPLDQVRNVGDVGSRLKDIKTPPHTAVTVKGVPHYPGNTLELHGGTYLAMQGAGSKTAEKFWDVMQEKGVEVSVSLTKHGEDRFRLIEHAPASGETLTFGSHTVTNVKSAEVLGGKFEIQFLLVDGQPHTRVCYRQWEDKTGSNAADMAALHSIVKSLKNNPDSPIAVNCNAGVGRTCTTIAAMEMMKAVESGEPLDSDGMNQLIADMRDARGPAAVQTKSQFYALQTLLKTQEIQSSAFSQVPQLV